jgi:hypothetical protein
MQCLKIELNTVTAVTAVVMMMMIMMVSAASYLLIEIKKSRKMILQGEN